MSTISDIETGVLTRLNTISDFLWKVFICLRFYFFISVFRRFLCSRQRVETACLRQEVLLFVASWAKQFNIGHSSLPWVSVDVVDLKDLRDLAVSAPDALVIVELPGLFPLRFQTRRESVHNFSSGVLNVAATRAVFSDSRLALFNSDRFLAVNTVERLLGTRAVFVNGWCSVFTKARRIAVKAFPVCAANKCNSAASTLNFSNRFLPVGTGTFTRAESHRRGLYFTESSFTVGALCRYSAIFEEAHL